MDGKKAFEWQLRYATSKQQQKQQRYTHRVAGLNNNRDTLHAIYKYIIFSNRTTLGTDAWM